MQSEYKVLKLWFRMKIITLIKDPYNVYFNLFQLRCRALRMVNMR